MQAYRKRAKTSAPDTSVGLLESDGSQGHWVAKHRAVRERMGIDVAAGCLSSRVSDLLLLAEQVTVKAGKDPSALITDVSQDGSRLPWVSDKLRSLTTSSSLHIHKVNRRMSVIEMFHLMGFDNVSLRTVSESQARDLLGESMAVPVISMVLCSLLLSITSAFARDS